MGSLAGEEKKPLGQPATMPTVKQIGRQKLKFSTVDASAILEKHQLGRLVTLKSLETNPMNSIFELTLEPG